MPISRRGFAALVLTAPFALTACARRSKATKSPPASAAVPGETQQVQALIGKYARVHGIPEHLLRRVVQRESGFNPRARNGPYYGLMQIHPATAATMGYRGPPEGLLDAETNLIYAGRYLRGAWIVARGSEDRAVMWYAKGYYYEAKRLGLLRETGLKA